MEEREKRRKTKSAQSLRRMLWGSGSIGFDMKLNFALALRLINGPTQKKLAELNRLRNKCSHNWLLKNHPSGIAQPSAEDKQLTPDLVEAAKTIDLRVLDHLIVGKEGSCSFAESRLLPGL